MQTLLQRLESLTAPSREVSDELLLSWGWKLTEEGRLDNPSLWWEAPNGDSFPNGDQPHPTASIDDALLGVPEGWFWWLGHLDETDRRFVATISQHAVVGTPSHKGFSPIPAIALCIAIVKARGGV